MAAPYLALSVVVVSTGASASGCSSAEPRPLPTVRVTNATCDSARCRTLQVRVFVSKFVVPGQLPLGWGSLGEAPPGQTCLSFPASWTLRVIGDTIVDDTTGQVDTVTTTWTPQDSSPVYLIAMDSVFMTHGVTQSQLDSSRARVWPYDGFFPGSVGETPFFIPGDAPGWSVTFPRAAGAAGLVKSDACTP